MWTTSSCTRTARQALPVIVQESAGVGIRIHSESVLKLTAMGVPTIYGWLAGASADNVLCCKETSNKIQCLAAGGQLSKDRDRGRGRGRGRGDGEAEGEGDTGSLLVELVEENVEAPDFEEVCRVERNRRKRVCNIGCRGDHVSL